MSFEQDPFANPLHAPHKPDTRHHSARLHGGQAQARHRGIVHHPHTHQLGSIPALHHPHHAALGAHQPGAHPRQGRHRSRVHLRARAGLQQIEMGLIQSYNAAANTAMVRLTGAQANLVGPLPLSQGLSPLLATVGATCLVVALDEANPADAAIVAIYNAPSAVWLQAGSATLHLTGYQLAQAVSFTVPFAGGLVGVTATSRQADFVASVSGETSGGFVLTLTRREGATQLQAGTANVAVGVGAASGSAAVSFPVAFAVARSVVATSGSGAWAASVAALTNTGCTLGVSSLSYGMTAQPAYNTPNPNTPATPVVQMAAGVVGPATGPATITVYWQATGDPAVDVMVTVDWLAVGN